MFDRSLVRINKTLATCDRVAVEKQEGQIAAAVNSLVRQTELTKVATSERSSVVAVGILLTTLGVGALMGWVYFDLKGGLRRGKRFI